jgi:hypothetical protein
VLAQKPVRLEVHELGGVLGQVRVGRRGAALLEELIGEHDPVAGADVDVDAGVARERRDQRARELRVLTVVEHERVRVRPTASRDGRAGGQHQDGRDRG